MLISLLAPIEQLQIDVAGRAEHYTDFGDAQIGKITARYDITPQYAIRGTIATGFRAPTIAEEYYTAVNVSPTSATVQLPADSVAAQAAGLSKLKPETSINYSVGIVAHPLDDLSVTVDAYSTSIGNRITASSTVYASGTNPGGLPYVGSPTSPGVIPAILATGASLDPTVTQLGISAFVNGIDTLTQGVDATINYPTDLGQYGLVDWTLAGNYNTTGVSYVAPAPVALGGAPLFTPTTLYDYEHSTPAVKVGLTANWSLDDWGVTLRETMYGSQHQMELSNRAGTGLIGASNVDPFNQASVGLTDAEVRYNVTDNLQLAIGGNNIFNIRPDSEPWDPNWGGTNAGAPVGGGQVAFGPFGAAFDPNGGYYYARVTITW